MWTKDISEIENPRIQILFHSINHLDYKIKFILEIDNAAAKALSRIGSNAADGLFTTGHIPVVDQVQWVMT